VPHLAPIISPGLSDAEVVTLDKAIPASIKAVGETTIDYFLC
jgi:hypothetical protein